jgi:hypothetical protein
MDVQVTFHALERYATHHPEAVEEDLRVALDQALELDSALALPLIGRNSTRQTGSRYFLAGDRRGLFVLEQGASRPVLITYLRFGPWQVAFSQQLWPTGRNDGSTPDPPDR